MRRGEAGNRPKNDGIDLAFSTRGARRRTPRPIQGALTMKTSRFERGMTWGGLALSAVAALGMTMLSAAGPAAAEENAERKSKIQLVVDRDGVAERLTLDDLHTMAVGESRTLDSGSGRPVTVTRDEDGFAIDLGGKTIRLRDELGDHVVLTLPEPGEGRTFEKRIVLRDGEEGEEGAGDMMFFHGTDDEPGKVVVVKRRSADGRAYAWSTNGEELPAFPLGVEGTISRLEQNATFQSLDAETRAKVLLALRESAPQAFTAGDGRSKIMMIEVEDEATSGKGE
jgi:hypothetical protein